ncbi:MAG: ATP-dependent DNA helicase [Ruminiclostridium sp.]
MSKKQEDAVNMAFRHNLSIIAGSPGTGKTTVLKTVIEVFQRIKKNGKILLTAPTGRASRRMAESTGFLGAKTLHSALGLVTSDEEDRYKNSQDPIDADLIIIDEFSMVDMWLAFELFSHIKYSTKILMVGDADQLPSVGAGNVFREFIACGLIPVTILDEIFRQSKDSLIAHNAKFINENNTRLYYGSDFIFRECETQQQAAILIQKIYMEEIAKDGVENVQILSSFRSDGEASAEKLNDAIRELVNPFTHNDEELKVGTRVFRVNDRVMQTKNKGGISNGDVGFVRSIEHGKANDSSVTIEFTDSRLVRYDAADLGIIDLAYAMTVHKAMGSEYKTVIIPMLSAHTILLYRNLIYTAVTRAKMRVVLVGQRSSLFLAIHRSKIDKRNTLLGSRIALYHKALMEDAQAEAVGIKPEPMKLTV